MTESAAPVAPGPSPFLDAGPLTRSNGLAIVQLSRDQFQPLYLHDAAGNEVDGYAEGAVLNTRFGSFPHSTMIGMPWGSQVRASVVDTGSRGRKRKRAKGEDKKKDKDEDEGAAQSEATSVATTAPSTPAVTATPPLVAASGFIHILPPTPELWTLSLPHRTQVVYTGDYSYILHRLRARPGSRLIEAGSGSGSFTHAAARAVYGRQSAAKCDQASSTDGHVFSYEFHHERYLRMRAELAQHGLAAPQGVVTLTNRDVYGDGFLLDNGTSPAAEVVFLDLPAPWRALEHLTRDQTLPGAAVSPLHPHKAVHLCTFSPCIEQVTRTVSVLRRLGWVDIDMVEIAHKRILVSRERPEPPSSGGGAPPPPRDVDEAVTRLRAIESRTREHNRQYWLVRDAEASGMSEAAQEIDAMPPTTAGTAEKSAAAAEKEVPTEHESPAFMDGALRTRVEPEIKTHTSYLVFAVLPRTWTAADEAAAEARWPCGGETGVIGAVQRELRKEQKRQQFNSKGESKKERKRKRREALAAAEEAEAAAAEAGVTEAEAAEEER